MIGVGVNGSEEVPIEISAEARRYSWRTIIACTRELCDGAQYELLDPLLIERLEAYRDDGAPVGDFLQAVIANDLKDALLRADDYNRASLFHLVVWMYNELPAPLWGSREKYEAHLQRKGMERAQEIPACGGRP